MDVLAAQQVYDNIVWYENSPLLAANDDKEKIEAGDSLVLSILDNDYLPHKEVTSISIVDSTTHGNSVIQNDTLFYQANADFSGTDSLSYSVADTLASDTARVIISVMDAKRSPVVRNDTFRVNKGKKRALDPLGNDEELDERPLYITEVTQGDKGETNISLDQRHIIYTPQNTDSGRQTTVGGQLY